MTSTQQNLMNTELWQSIGHIANDESLMRRLTRYAKKLAKEKDDPALMSQEEFLARVDAAKEGETYELKEGETIEDLIKRVN